MKPERQQQLPTPEPMDAKDLLADFFGTPKDVLAKYSLCPMCGSNMHFHYLTDFATNRTQETARCLECAMKIRRLVHVLQ
ncbi:MAG TPA: hypothetical protein VL588_01675 [Bdellovibrionota bacterium]|nr:hypothetical protein [Bdellovibrionota bacterium]